MMRNDGAEFFDMKSHKCPPDPILARLEQEITKLKLNPTFVLSDIGYFQHPDTIFYTCDTLKHELIHFLDFHTVKFDMNDCRHNSCSEIRANALSGDCEMLKEIRRGKWPSFEQCVKRRSKDSVKKIGCDPSVVDQVFDQCIKDTYPF